MIFKIMHKNDRQRIWIALVIVVVVLFGIFMMLTVPEAQTDEGVMEMDEVQ